MKTSDYHKTHGLDGYLRLTQSGEIMHFRFDKGVTKLHLTGQIGSNAVEGYIEVVPRSGTHKDEPIDCTLTLTVPGPVTSAKVKKGVMGTLDPSHDPFKNHSAYAADLQSKQLPKKDETTATEIADGPPSSTFDMLEGGQETAVGRPSRNDDTVFPKFNEVIPLPGALVANPLNPRPPQDETIGPAPTPDEARDYIDSPNVQQVERAGSLNDAPPPSMTAAEIGSTLEKQGVKTESGGGKQKQQRRR